jgi:hypothetical protein
MRKTVMLTHSAAAAMMTRGRNGQRRLGNNTYLRPCGDDFVVRFHATNVVTIHADGTYTLNTGGWETSTTKERLNSWSPARVFSERGTWGIWHRDDPKTEPKFRACRICRGAGRVSSGTGKCYYTWSRDGGYRRIFPPVITVSRWAECYACNGTGQRDYGSKSMPVIFFDGIRVDSDGRVLDGNSALARMHEPAEIIAARIAKLQAATLRAWIRTNRLAARNGTVTMFKAVGDDLMSAHGAYYRIGTTVTARDYQPTLACGAGLHFSPTVAGARTYDTRASRFLACAVDRETMIHLEDKVKARTCRVLYEVDADGNRIRATR